MIVVLGLTMGSAVEGGWELPDSASDSPAPVVRGGDKAADRPYLLERVGEAAVVQLYADGFESLPLDQRILVYHLYRAALAGRDIFYDQRYVHNLEMREVLEQILTHADGVDPDTRAEIERYTKLFWINTGPYNNLTARKFVLTCTEEAFLAAAQAAVDGGAKFPTQDGETLDVMLTRMLPLFLDPSVDPSVTTKTPDLEEDILMASANNLYVDVTMDDLESFKEQYALNSRLVKRGDHVVEEVYKLDGKYGEHISQIIKHLEAAIPYATESMAKALKALIRFYRTGEDADRKAYDIAWIQDDASPIDTINGFVEVYMDARGTKGAWEALVYYVNQEKTAEIQVLADNAQWFEDRMPWDPKYRKKGVRGITANAIDVVIETGESGPVTPIGINLPNDQSVREEHGSKSVSLSNVVETYEHATPSGFRTEFSLTPAEATRAERWSRTTGELTTNMHEVIGHASGRLADHLNGNPQAALKEQYSALEESRADLVALYFLPDPQLAEFGLVPVEHHNEIVLAGYEGYARNAITQLRRVRKGTQLEEDHMRNRQMIVRWLMDNTTAIEERVHNSKTFYVITGVTVFQQGVGELLAEVQRIKSEGDYEAAKWLFQTYGIHFDADLRDQVVERVDALNLPSYSGFVQPKLDVERDTDNTIIDVTISYPQDLMTQMLEYSGNAVGMVRPRGLH